MFQFILSSVPSRRQISGSTKNTAEFYKVIQLLKKSGLNSAE